VPYLSASAVVFHEEALHQVYVPLPIFTPLCVLQYECSASAGLSIVLHGGTKLQCLYAGHELHVDVDTDNWLHRGSILCPACDEICEV